VDHLIEGVDLDRLAPFGITCDASGVVVRTGPSLARLVPDLVGRPLLDALAVVRPAGVTDVTDLLAVRDSFVLLRSLEQGLDLRMQVTPLREPQGMLLVGSPVVGSSDELEARGLSAADFSPIDQTPDLLLLRRGQAQNLLDLRALNAELAAKAQELRAANRTLQRTEAQYRRIVELQPLVMYIDRLGPTVIAEFMSANVESWLGYPAERFTVDPTFFVSIVHPDDRDRFWRAHLAADRENLPFDLEFRLVAADGRTVWTRASDSVVYEDDAPEGRRIGFMLDVTATKDAELELRETTSRLSTLLERMGTGVLVEDQDRRVVLANEALCGIFRSEARPEDLVGLPVSRAVGLVVRPADGPDAVLARTDEVLRQRWPVTAEPLTLSDGRVLELDFQPVVDAGEELGALWVFRDVTARVRNEQALATARDEAIRASEARMQFLASMSHEIRTPMHGVLATIDLLRTTPLDAGQRELVDVVGDSAGALVTVINDILDLQKVESGRIELVPEPCDIRSVVDGVVGLLGPQARQKGLTLTGSTSPEIPAGLLCDPVRLRQVLVNLVGNAVKFTSEGAVAVTVRAAQGAPEPGEVGLVVEVSDTGEGIPQDRLADVFDPFVQARPGAPGTGLGLAISARLVGLMGGTLSVSSTPGVGSVFSFRLRLPLAPVTDEAPLPADPGGIVLVADGSQASRSLLMRQLARLGVTARAVATGAELLASLRHGAPFTTVVVDLALPDLPGTAVLEAIADHQRGAAAPLAVVALVSGVDPSTLDACRAHGLDAELTKPVDISALRAAVGTAARPVRTSREDRS
jgi:PAS domain S-box-containing protein